MGATLPQLTRDGFADQLRAGSSLELGDEVVAALFVHYELLRRWNRRLSLIGPGTAGEVIARHYGEALAAVPLLDVRDLGARDREPDDPEPNDPEPNDSELNDPELDDPESDDGHPTARRLLNPRAAVRSSAAGRTLVDVGSGAGFPGFVLAVVRPDWNVVLTEARTRKWSFLRSAIRAAAEQVSAASRDRSEGASPVVPSPGESLSCSSLNARIARPLPRELPAVIDVVTCRAVRLDHEWIEALIEHSPAARFLLWQGADQGLPGLLREVRAVPIGGGSSRRIVEAVAKEIG